MSAQVVDSEKSEVGLQRKRAVNGRLLHCCCICGAVEPWGNGWSTYCSFKDIDDQAPIPKFCSDACKERGGTKAANVTEQMKRAAKEAEWRPPAITYRAATDREKYLDALSNQRSRAGRQADTEEKQNPTSTLDGEGK